MARKRTDGATTRSQQKTAGVRKTAGHGAKSQAVRNKAILALLSERNIPRAAAKCGVCERTLHKWLSQDEAFQADYAAARRATFKAGMSPEREQGERCACGAELEYFTVVDVLHVGPHPAYGEASRGAD